MLKNYYNNFFGTQIKDEMIPELEFTEPEYYSITQMETVNQN